MTRPQMGRRLHFVAPPPPPKKKMSKQRRFCWRGDIPMSWPMNGPDSQSHGLRRRNNRMWLYIIDPYAVIPCVLQRTRLMFGVYGTDWWNLSITWSAVLWKWPSVPHHMIMIMMCCTSHLSYFGCTRAIGVFVTEREREGYVYMIGTNVYFETMQYEHRLTCLSSTIHWG